jgi:hypothetical protein
MNVQTKYISDRTSAMKLAVWGSHINSIKTNNSYRLTNVSVKCLHECKHLSAIPQTELKEIDALEDYKTLQEVDVLNLQTMQVELLAVQIAMHY